MTMVTLPRAKVQRALKALEYMNVTAEHRVDDRIPEAAIAELKAALEQPEPGGVCARCGGWVCDPVISQPGSDAKTFNDGVLEGVMRERAQWQSVFGHLGSADEVGNEWISTQEQRDKLLDALKALCESHKRFFGGSWDNARSVIKEVESKR